MIWKTYWKVKSLARLWSVGSKWNHLPPRWASRMQANSRAKPDAKPDAPAGWDGSHPHL